MLSTLWQNAQAMSGDILALAAKHSEWLAVASFVLAFVKSLPFVALAVPGTALLLSIGMLIGAGELRFTPIWLAVAVGAGLGDWVSFWLGRYYGPRILASHWIQRRYPLYLRTKRFFDHWGWVSIVLCRFFGPLRATIPLVAGIFSMPERRFQSANWISAFIWSAALLLPGWAGFQLF